MIKILIIILLILIIFKSYRIESEMDRKKITTKKRLFVLENMFKNINNLCQINNIKIFLLYGTLLGKIRDDKIICYDYDLDLGIKTEDFNKVKNILETNLDKSKYKIEIVNNYFIKYLKIVDVETKLNCDIFSFKNNSKEVWRIVPGFFSKYYGKECRVKFPINWLYPLKKTTFLGQQTYIPNNSHKLLECYYKDYKIPNHECNDDCTVCKKKIN